MNKKENKKKSDLKKIFDEFNINISEKEISDLCILSVSGGTTDTRSVRNIRNSNTRLYGVRKSKNINFMRGGRILKQK